MPAVTQRCGRFQVQVHHRCLGPARAPPGAPVDSRSTAAIARACSHVARHRGSRTEPGEARGRVRPDAVERPAVALAPCARLGDHVVFAREAASRPARRAPCRTRRRPCRRARRSRRRTSRRRAWTPRDGRRRGGRPAPRPRANSTCSRGHPTGAARRRSRVAAARRARRPGARRRVEVVQRHQLAAVTHRHARPGHAGAGRPCPRGAPGDTSDGTRRPAGRGDRRGLRSAICCAIVPLGMKTAAGLPSELADLGLEGGHHPARAVLVGGQLLGRQRSEPGEHLGGAAQSMAAKRTLAVMLQSRPLFVRQGVGVDHGSSVRGAAGATTGSPSHYVAGVAQ